MQFLTNEYQVGLKSWRKNENGTLNEDWFVGQTSRALSVPYNSVLSSKAKHQFFRRHILQIVFLNSREDFFNVDLEGFTVPTSDQGASDRGLIVTFMVARENREDIEQMLRLLGHRLVLRVSKVQFGTVV
jgi:hypothetical protein